jgi:diguanylate cyclase (GGDEF)-like protein
MKDPANSLTRSDDQSQHAFANLSLALFGLFAPLATFMLAVSGVAYQVKVAGLLVVAAVYAAVCVWSFSRLRAANAVAAEEEISTANDLLGSQLEALDDARHFFGSSLKSGDMFRLVSSRVSEIFPHENATLYLADKDNSVLRISETDAEEFYGPSGTEISNDAGLAGLAYFSGEAELDADLRLTRPLVKGDLPRTIKAAAAVPLMHEGSTFGVFEMLLNESPADGLAARDVLESVGERISPLFLTALSFERSLSNALTDTLTNLPNERAFYMVLENQLAESHRFRDERPLTVLAIDIKGFDELNQKIGHTFGNETLMFVADRLRGELRKMDFLARSTNDEFLAILPTANELVAAEIVSRINSSFSDLAYPTDDSKQFLVRLNFGAATFWGDGETAKQLMQHAQLKKQQAKSEDADNVIWFPKQYVN